MWSIVRFERHIKMVTFSECTMEIRGEGEVREGGVRKGQLYLENPKKKERVRVNLAENPWTV